MSERVPPMVMPEESDFRLLCEASDGAGKSLQLDSFQVVFDVYLKQIRINLTGHQLQRIAEWGWKP